jgi:hypothetical protein
MNTGPRHFSPAQTMHSFSRLLRLYRVVSCEMVLDASLAKQSKAHPVYLVNFGRCRYVSAILITPIYTRYPRSQKPIMHTGCILSAAGILLSGFATKPWHLIVTSGFMYPVGGAMVYLPSATLLFEWFQQKRGLANGIMYCKRFCDYEKLRNLADYVHQLGLVCTALIQTGRPHTKTSIRSDRSRRRNFPIYHASSLR